MEKNQIETKETLFEINNGDTAKNMLTGGKNQEKTEEKAVEPSKEVIQVTETIEETKEQSKPLTNRGRKRKYQEGEMVKLTVLLDKGLSSALKKMVRSRGETVQDVMVPYIEKWVETNHELNNPNYTHENKKNEKGEFIKKYTGFQVLPELRQAFSDACTKRRKTQSFVIETLYKQAMRDVGEF